jgi:hypothetical protein
VIEIDSLAWYAGLFFYHFTIDNTVGLALVLTLNGYDIKKNWRRVLLAGVILGAVNIPLFSLPQALRIVSWMAVTYAVVKIVFRLSTTRTFLVLFTCLATIPIAWSACFILRHGFDVPLEHFLVSLPLRLLFPLSYDIPIGILACVCYSRRWRLFGATDGLSIPLKIVIPPAVQVVLLGITLNEFLFAPTPHVFPPWTIEFLTLFLMSVPWLLSMFFLWRILGVAEQEAVVSAQEQSAREIALQTEAVAAQRHDFNNHLQIIAGLIKDGRKKELALYLKELKKEPF